MTASIVCASCDDATAAFTIASAMPTNGMQRSAVRVTMLAMTYLPTGPVGSRKIGAILPERSPSALPGLCATEIADAPSLLTSDSPAFRIWYSTLRSCTTFLTNEVFVIAPPAASMNAGMAISNTAVAVMPIGQTARSYVPCPRPPHSMRTVCTSGQTGTEMVVHSLPTGMPKKTLVGGMTSTNRFVRSGSNMVRRKSGSDDGKSTGSSTRSLASRYSTQAERWRSLVLRHAKEIVPAPSALSAACAKTTLSGSMSKPQLEPMVFATHRSPPAAASVTSAAIACGPGCELLEWYALSVTPYC